MKYKIVIPLTYNVEVVTVSFLTYKSLQPMLTSLNYIPQNACILNLPEI